MTTVNEFIRIFGGKMTVLLQQESARQFVVGKDKEKKQLVVKKQFRGRWKVVSGADFVKNFFPRTEKANEIFLSNSKVKQLLFYAKKHPKVLEVAFLERQAAPVSTDLPVGNGVETQSPEDNKSGSCDATPTGTV